MKFFLLGKSVQNLVYRYVGEADLWKGGDWRGSVIAYCICKWLDGDSNRSAK
jgi:hypothetical protein